MKRDKTIELVIGTANLGQEYGIGSYKLNEKEFLKILQAKKMFLETSIDTSPSYGKAESICNQTLPTNQRVYLKKRYISDTREFERTILRKDFRITELVHNWDDLILSDQKDSIRRLEEKSLLGEIEGFGISTYGVCTGIEWLDPKSPLVIQAPLNVLNQSNLSIFEEVKDRFERVKVLVRSVFLQGLLTKDIGSKSLDSHKHVKKFKEFCNDLGISCVEACLEFVLAQELVDGIVIGVTNLDEAKQISKKLSGARVKSLLDFDWSVLRSDDDKLVDPRNW